MRREKGAGMRIKIDLGGGEIRNTEARVIRRESSYRLEMPDGSFDNCAHLDIERRVFFSC